MSERPDKIAVYPGNKARVGQAPPAVPPPGFASRPTTLGGGGPAQLGHARIR